MNLVQTARCVRKLTSALALLLVVSGCGSGSSSDSSGSSTVSPVTGESTGQSTTTGSSTPSAATTDAVAFTAASYSVEQAAGSISVSVARPGNATTAISVDYSTSDGSAVAGTDYVAQSGTLDWAENDSTPKSVLIPISNTLAFSGSRSFTIALSNPTGDALIGNPGAATVTISGAASADAGMLELADPSYSAAQSAGSVTLTVNRSGGSIGASSVAYATADGTAVAGTDYTATSGTLQWADGDSSAKTVTIALSTSDAFDGTRTFTITLSNATGSLLGTPASSVVSILGSASNSAGTLQLSNSSYSVAQSAQSITILVNRSGGAAGAVSVGYSTADATANSGRDYTAASGVLQWADGDTSPKSFQVAISDATAFSGSRTFKVSLTNPSGNTAISSPGSATVTIAGDGAPPVGSLELSSANYGVLQGAGTATVTVDRVGGSSGATSVSYSTSNGSASAGSDFTATSGTLTWSSGDASAKTIQIPISNAVPFSSTRSFTVLLTNPGSGAALGSPNRATVTISGDAPTATGSLQLSSSAYSVGQNAGAVKMTVNRTGGTTGAISVNYSTSNGSAIAGTNYTATSGTLQWSSGDGSSKTISIPVSGSPAFSGTLNFTLQLTSPSGGATLSAPTSATATITGSGSSGSSGGPFWVYYDGQFNWGGDYSFVAVPNYQDTSGGPISGSYDIAVTVTGPFGGFLPYAGGTVPLWNFDDSPYTYLTFAFKPTVANQTAQVFFVKIGDVPVGIVVNPFNGQYGPTPQVGVWGTYKIPLSDLGVKNTSVYKFGIQDETGLSHNVFYLDNIGFE